MSPQPERIYTVSTGEFTLLIALLMSIVAISIDALLPALGVIRQDFHLENPNQAQYVISALFCGMALGQLFCGPLSDALGRKKILTAGIVLYLVGTVICLLVDTFENLLIGRFIQGLGVAGPYVSAMAIVRDQFSGRQMAKIMSLVMIIFISVPAIAPMIGQAILLVASWRGIFIFYGCYAALISLWIFLRLEETLPKEKRIVLSSTSFIEGFKEVISNRVTMSYTLCMGLLFGSFIGYLNSSQQIFQTQFSSGKLFSLYFGLLALVFGLSSLANSRFVERLGMHYICHQSLKYIIGSSIIFALLHLGVNIQLWMFLIYAGILFFCFGLMFGNLNTIAMEPMGHIAGIASAIIGSLSSILSMVIGTAIGQLYNNSLIPVTLGFLILALCSLLLIRFADKNY